MTWGDIAAAIGDAALTRAEQVADTAPPLTEDQRTWCREAPRYRPTSDPAHASPPGDAA